MNKKEIVITPLNRLFDKFDDSFEEEFHQKILNGEFNSDEEAIDYLKKDLKKSFPDLNLYPDLEL